MMKFLLRTLFLAVAVLSTQLGNAQCANDNALTAGNLTPPGVSQSTTVLYTAGQYVLCQVVSGANYTISTCGTSWDTQITVYDDLTGTFIAYNDDFCGLQSTTSFTASTCGFVRVLLDRFSCTTTADQANVTVTMNTAGSAPTLTAAPDESACYGQPANIGIVSNGTGGTPPYTYSWLPVTNLSSTNTPSTTVTTVTTTTVYTLTITDASGCSSSDQVTVSVLAAAPVTLGNDTAVCATSFTLDAGNPGSSYLWSTGAGTQQLNITQSGNYSVTVQFPSGCVASDNIVVTMTTPPAYSVGNDTTTCGNGVVLDAGSGFNSYSWSTGSTTQTTNVSSSDTVGVTVIDANGCTMTDTLIVTLSPAPAVTLGADTTQCGGAVVLDAGNPGSLYFWSNSTSSQTTSVTTSGTYFVNVLSQAGCSGTDTINVTINNQPDVNLGPDSSICLATVILDAGNPGSTYLWSNSAVTQTITVGSGTYYVTATDPSGCADSDTIIVTTNVPPTVTAGQDTSICVGGMATFTANGAQSYLWSTGSTNNPLSVTPTVTTSYYVTGTDANGCQASDVVIVTIIPSANALFTSTVSMATGFFTNQSTGAFTYSWNFGDSSPLDNSANPSHQYATNGTYTVTLTITSACGVDTYTQVITINDVGMEDNSLANTLNIYPNPNNGQFTVSFNLAEAKDVTMQLTDVSGRVINSELLQNVTSYTHVYDQSNLANGMYFVTLTTADGVVTRRIAVQK